jgi:hypothetical protein
MPTSQLPADRQARAIDGSVNQDEKARVMIFDKHIGKMLQPHENAAAFVDTTSRPILVREIDPNAIHMSAQSAEGEFESSLQASLRIVINVDALTSDVELHDVTPRVVRRIERPTDS